MGEQHKVRGNFPSFSLSAHEQRVGEEKRSMNQKQEPPQSSSAKEDLYSGIKSKKKAIDNTIQEHPR
ncbi:hypothetical protein BDW66DRAFT_128812 [Aspergillus desertorum]